jgi:hypothetical protein
MSSDVELNEIGVLKRREIEARLLAPIVDALGDKFGRQEVLEVVRDVVTEIARRQGSGTCHSLGQQRSILSCGRDATFIEGFNGEIALERKHTILQGSRACDFRSASVQVLNRRRRSKMAIEENLVGASLLSGRKEKQNDL